MSENQLAETYHKQRPVKQTRRQVTKVFSEQPLNLQNQITSGLPEKESKKPAKSELPVSLGDNPFDRGMDATNPQSEVDRQLSARSDDTALQPDQVAAEKQLASLQSKLKRSETEVITLRHQLAEAKADLKAAEDRLREKDKMIREQGKQIDELIDERVPMDDMEAALLAECQKLLEEYVAADTPSN
ncbi:hypothetical protein DL89DRAFT_265996 [Linderina pennispora]|uniref:Uncharacterized protein n=1 Tax=Linderina pennispora TaxID=61395 RepID=A0A1Y1WGC3_9FUNG|nr:uncharacterized protein DL89DRAFT_265996 [Linderina pennispora]ORX72445.1 hypothetical protein DL89DRAFT_265996 [Linderina pennispora]